MWNVKWNCVDVSWLKPQCIDLSYFSGRQNSLEYWMSDNENHALPIQVLLLVIYKHCLTIVVVIIVQNNVELNLCYVSWHKIPSLSYFRGDERLQKIWLLTMRINHCLFKYFFMQFESLSKIYGQCSSTREYEIEFVWCFLAQNPISTIF